MNYIRPYISYICIFILSIMYGYSIITVYSYFNLYVPGNFEPLVVKVSNNKLRILCIEQVICKLVHSFRIQIQYPHFIYRQATCLGKESTSPTWWANRLTTVFREKRHQMPSYCSVTSLSAICIFYILFYNFYEIFAFYITFTYF